MRSTMPYTPRQKYLGELRSDWFKINELVANTRNPKTKNALSKLLVIVERELKTLNG